MTTERLAASREAEYCSLVAPFESRLRRALVGHFGVEVGTDVCAEALAWAWEHLDQLRAAPNPAGLLFRVGQSAARRHRRWNRGRVALHHDVAAADIQAPGVDADLLRALGSLKPPQRTAVLMVHGYGFTYVEVAEVLGVSVPAVTNHVHRGLRRLRRELGAT